MSSPAELAARLAAVVSAQQEILASLTNIDKVLQIVVRTAPEITGGTGAVVEFVVEDDELVYRAASGAAERHVGLHLSMKTSLSGLAVRTRAMVQCSDTETDPRVDKESCRSIGIRSMVVAPLLSGERVLGALKTFSPEPNAFADIDVYTLQVLAGICSSAVTHAQEYDERRASEERYRLLFDQNVAGVFRTTPEGRFLDCNEALVSSLGYASREDLLSRETWDLYVERSERESLLRSLKENPALTNVRLRLKRKDGSQMTGILNASLITNEGTRQILGTFVPAPDPPG